MDAWDGVWVDLGPQPRPWEVNGVKEITSNYFFSLDSVFHLEFPHTADGTDLGTASCHRAVSQPLLLRRGPGWP